MPIPLLPKRLPQLIEVAGTGHPGVLVFLVLQHDVSAIVHFDYFSSNCSFAWNFDVKAQYCWAHLIRDIRFLEKHPNKKARRWAGRLLDRTLLGEIPRYASFCTR